MSDLKPCPFCGEEAKVGFYNNGEGHADYYVECSNDRCDVAPSVSDSSIAYANKYWNTRAQSQWISVDVEPAIGQEVLIKIPVCEKFNIESAKYLGNGEFRGCWGNVRGKDRPYEVIHWLPLPPKAGE